MKEMRLTGLATEQRFSSHGIAQFYLVFNDGELRVPVDESAARLVASAMLSSNGSSRATEPPTQVDEDDDYHEADDEDDVVTGDAVLDEDGVDQI